MGAMKKTLLSILVLGTIAQVSAALIAHTVNYEQGGVKLQGYVAYDDAVAPGRKVPGVLVVPEWWGLNDYVKDRARQLAGLGYVAFVADMYGGGTSTRDAKQAGALATPFYGKPLMAQRAQAALDQLAKTTRVDAQKIAAIGYCFGGSTVQVLAYSGAKVVGIVSFHGGIVPVPADAAQKNHAKILMCNGAIDPMVPPEAVAGFMKSMNEGKFDYQFIDYSGAKHAFTNPEATKLAAENHVEGIEYNESADRRSWAHMQVFFNEIFATR